VIFGLAHVISCMWYGIGRLNSSGETAWIRRYGAISNSFLFKYFLSVHWAMTQFMPANMEVVPDNFPERFFSVCVLLFALIVFSAFLSNLTHLMLKFGHLFCRDDEEKSLLRRYLRDRKVSKQLAFRVKKSVDDALKSMHARSVVDEKDVALLILLSEPLRMDLRHEGVDIIFRPRSFFRVLHEESVHATRELCFTGLHNSHFSWGDNMFSENEANAAHSAFFLAIGELKYRIRDPDRLTNEVVVVKKLRWSCEPSLWLENWVHVGTLRASASSCETIHIDVEEFIRITGKHANAARLTKSYAQLFVKKMNRILEEGQPLSDLTSLSGDDWRWDAAK